MHFRLTKLHAKGPQVREKKIAHSSNRKKENASGAK